MSGKGNEAYEKLDREITAKYGHMYQRRDPNAPERKFAPAEETFADRMARRSLNALDDTWRKKQ